VVRSSEPTAASTTSRIAGSKPTSTPSTPLGRSWIGAAIPSSRSAARTTTSAPRLDGANGEASRATASTVGSLVSGSLVSGSLVSGSLVSGSLVSGSSTTTSPAVGSTRGASATISSADTIASWRTRPRSVRATR
jgi:hypothetical protein